jgi:hypothetical protein
MLSAALVSDLFPLPPRRIQHERKRQHADPWGIKTGPGVLRM